MANVDFEKLINYQSQDSILNEMIADLKAQGSKITDLTTTSETVMKLFTIARAVSVLHDNALEEARQLLDVNPEGDYATLRALQVNVTRDEATNAEYNQTFNRVTGGTGNITISQGTLVKTALDDSDREFRYFVTTTTVMKDAALGTGTISSSGVNVTGVNTLAGTEFSVGDEIVAGGQTRTIDSITDSVNFTTSVAFSPVLSSDTFTFKHNSIKAPIKAESPGGDYNAADGTIVVMVNAIAGIDSTTNKTGDQTVTAIDDQADGSLNTERLGKWTGLARAHTVPRLETLAREVAGVDKVFVDATSSRGLKTSDVLYTLNSGIPTIKNGTGTITIAQDGTTVSGSGTLFLDELKPGDRLVVADDTDTTLKADTRIETIDSNTSLTIKHALHLKLTGTVQVTQNSTAVVGTGTLFTTELANGESVMIKGELFTVTVTDATNLTLSSVFKGESGTGLKIFRTNPVTATANSFTYVETNLVHEKINNKNEKVINTDVEANIPTGVLVNFTYTIIMNPDRAIGDTTTMQADALGVIDALFIADPEKYPNVQLLNIGQDVKVEMVKGMLWQLNDPTQNLIVNITTSDTDTVINNDELAIKGTVNITVNRATTL